MKEDAISDYFKEASTVYHIYLAVKTEYQKQGMGKQLLEKVKTEMLIF